MGESIESLLGNSKESAREGAKESAGEGAGVKENLANERVARKCLGNTRRLATNHRYMRLLWNAFRGH